MVQEQNDMASMSFEPQKFFIGVIEFFSILLPGAVLTYLFKDAVGPQILDGGYGHLHGTESWLVFLFSSYLLGHFLFFIGSRLDDFAYDPLRKMTNDKQITRVLNGRELSPKVLRWLAWLCFKKDADAAVDRVVPIKENYLERIDAPEAVNAFQWCKARLSTEHPEALATVNRFEADSKFFRSFVPVLLVVLGTALHHHQWWLAMGSIVAVGLAFLRYMEQRFKSTQQAYWHILTMEASKEPSSSNVKPPSSEGKSALPTHAGGIVFRKRGSQTEYLLLQAKTDPNDWVLPKGHIELGEDPRRCAIREVKEETGVWARIRKDLKVSEYVLADEPVRVQFYLMEAIDQGQQEDLWRKHKWLPLDGARSLTKHPEIEELLMFAEQTAL
jgi:8-oxo-dGTP pyrophosphatase MutT (NUDIX family)